MRIHHSLTLSIPAAALLSAAAWAQAPAAGDVPGGAAASSRHVTVALLPESQSVRPGQPFSIGVRLQMEPGWHTYWKNPGDSGLPTRVAWRLPEGVTAGPLQWPRPERFLVEPLMSYGYEREVLLITELQAPRALASGASLAIGAKVDWLECKQSCLPGKAELTLALPVREEAPAPEPRWAAAFASARAALPKAPAPWSLEATAAEAGFTLVARGKGAAPREAYFFPDRPEIVEHAAPQALASDARGFRLALQHAANGQSPDALAGVLVVDGAAFEVSAPLRRAGAATKPAAAPPKPAPAAPESHPSPAARPQGQRSGLGAVTRGAGGALVASRRSIDADALAAVGDGTAGAAGEAPSTTPERPVAAPVAAGTSSAPSPGRAPASTASAGSLPAALGLAFLGGLILNLMPCVLPVLSLKIMGFVRHGESRRGALRHGLAFTAGVLVFFWLLAGALLALRAGGQQIGWGFQLQSPAFVVFLSALFLLVALNLLGVFEVGYSLTAIGNLEPRAPGLGASFWNGALATLVATPCTAPFMGSALGFALTQSAAVSIAIFTALGLGMASPYLLLPLSPGLMKRLPRPGAWMETLKQAMGFPLLATVAFLVWLFGRQVGVDAMAWLLAALLLVALGAWTYGRGAVPHAPARQRYAALAGAVVLVAAGLAVGLSSAHAAPARSGSTGATSAAPASEDGWEAYSPERLEALRRAGTPVFVDFTADWCLTCQVNQRVALERPEVRSRFRERGVVLLKADWTRRDEAITRALAEHGRQGVPFYLLYGRDAAPHALPEVLSPGLVLGALDEIS